MTFTIPNLPGSASVEQQVQSAPDQYDFQALVNADGGTGLVSGCAVTQNGGGAMSVVVASGVVAVAGAEVNCAGATATITTANGSNPRLDLVVVDATGAVSVTAGTAAASPVFPPLTSVEVLLAAVYVGTSVSSILTADIQGKAIAVPAALGLVNRVPGSDRTIPANYSSVCLSEFVMDASHELIFADPSEMWVA